MEDKYEITFKVPASYGLTGASEPLWLQDVADQAYHSQDVRRFYEAHNPGGIKWLDQ